MRWQYFLAPHTDNIQKLVVFSVKLSSRAKVGAGRLAYQWFVVIRMRACVRACVRAYVHGYVRTYELLCVCTYTMHVRLRVNVCKNIIII